MFVWRKKLDKKLILTWRVKRFLILLLSLVFFQNFLCTLKDACQVYGVFMPLAMAYIGSYIIEKFLFEAFKKEAKKRLLGMKDLQIVAITGSYGKTSIKNFVAQILSNKFRVYATPEASIPSAASSPTSITLCLKIPRSTSPRRGQESRGISIPLLPF